VAGTNVVDTAVAVVTGTAVVGSVVGTGVVCGAVVCVQPATRSRSIRNAMPPRRTFIFM
jgi:hydroxyethylthiazole kinase-like sugar kinase family protein